MATKSRILDAAERLFADNGIAATSLRSIIAAAGVNLAAVHYHFRNREALIDAVIARRAAPINAARLAALDALESGAHETMTTEQVLEAFIAPTVRAVGESHDSGHHLGRLMGRVLAEPGEVFAEIFERHFKPVAQRFATALHRTRPDLSPEEISWRLFFCVGTMAYALTASEKIRIISRGLCDSSDLDALSRRLISFAAAGFNAEVPGRS